MGAFSFDHLPGCSPIKPCTVCKAVMFLRRTLTPPEFEAFAAIALGTEHDSEIKKAPLLTPISTFRLSMRTYGPLQTDNIKTIEDLVRMTEAEMLRIPNFGRKGLNEVKQELAKAGWKIGELPRASEAPETTEG